MTSENALGDAKAMETIANNEGPNVLPPNDDKSTIEKIEEEKINIEKPKRPGRKRKELTSTSSVKEENSNNDNDVLDTQPLFEQPIILEGKRSRKPTSRLELSDLETPKKELSIPQGHGKPLGEIEYINYQITYAAPDVLSRMRNICFGRRASHNDIRENLREFKGFEFERGSDEYQRHLTSLTKMKKDQLRPVLDILGLPLTGRHDEHAQRILEFLLQPVDEGKKIPERKTSMRSSTKSSSNSKPTTSVHDDDNEFEEKSIDNDQDELFFEEEEEEDPETDDDYIGSDEESSLNTRDDPEDFVYEPGKKTPKKRPSIRRSKRGNTNKRKKAAATPSKRGRKKAKIVTDDSAENENNTTDPTVPMQIDTREVSKSNENNLRTKESNLTDIKNDNLNIEQTDTNMNNKTVEIIPTTN